MILSDNSILGNPAEKYKQNFTGNAGNVSAVRTAPDRRAFPAKKGMTKREKNGIMILKEEEKGAFAAPEAGRAGPVCGRSGAENEKEKRKCISRKKHVMRKWNMKDADAAA